MHRASTAHTSEFTPAGLERIRALLDLAFEGDFTADDWDHTLCGIHATVHGDGGELLAHGSLVQRRLLHGGRALRTGYVEAVAVHPGHRRQGLASAVMEALERVLHSGGYHIGALGAAAAAVPLYTGRGWQQWRGRTAVLSPDGVVRTPEEDGHIYVLPMRSELALDGELVCDWRPGDVW
ncbi:GNAT family N-acetyltransferase [Streptomyces sp. ET3-23]|uniref:GNAT family N-acetyltransferase n=1 Tax=Streptomyces sp. ET3-23 TaxID=2885643 RepID=UPI001D1194F4|nr:GNAT family N-acetyltransferase [Streptomyces sp. ET3-23]MCC2279966.1 GNAT family N-acetyltransferase [Streptomyces sp. ET3-23]